MFVKANEFRTGGNCSIARFSLNNVITTKKDMSSDPRAEEDIFYPSDILSNLTSELEGSEGNDNTKASLKAADLIMNSLFSTVIALKGGYSSFRDECGNIPHPLNDVTRTPTMLLRHLIDTYRYLACESKYTPPSVFEFTGMFEYLYPKKEYGGIDSELATWGKSHPLYDEITELSAVAAKMTRAQYQTLLVTWVSGGQRESILPLVKLLSNYR